MKNNDETSLESNYHRAKELLDANTFGRDDYTLGLSHERMGLMIYRHGWVRDLVLGQLPSGQETQPLDIPEYEQFRKEFLKKQASLSPSDLTAFRQTSLRNLSALSADLLDKAYKEDSAALQKSQAAPPARPSDAVARPNDSPLAGSFAASATPPIGPEQYKIAAETLYGGADASRIPVRSKHDAQMIDIALKNLSSAEWASTAQGLNNISNRADVAHMPTDRVYRSILSDYRALRQNIESQSPTGTSFQNPSLSAYSQDYDRARAALKGLDGPLPSVKNPSFGAVFSGYQDSVKLIRNGLVSDIPDRKLVPVPAFQKILSLHGNAMAFLREVESSKNGVPSCDGVLGDPSLNCRNVDTEPYNQWMSQYAAQAKAVSGDPRARHARSVDDLNALTLANLQAAAPEALREAASKEAFQISQTLMNERKQALDAQIQTKAEDLKARSANLPEYDVGLPGLTTKPAPRIF